jgi:predicted subunit of tRNA(5-methylaminomethyl-2-thiouridylate) methyltransferase
VYCISRLRFSDIGGMAEVDEQRVCIKFCVSLGKTGSETFEMLKQAIFAMEESWVSKTQKSTYAKKQTEDDAHLFL